MPDLDPYKELLDHLLLPEPILGLVAPTFAERGCPLQRETTLDWEEKTLEYFRAKTNGQQIVLLHMAGDIISDRTSFRDVASIGSLFVAKAAGLFFFAPTKDLIRDYTLSLAPRWEEENPNIKRVRFYDQSDIDTLQARAEAERSILINRMMDLKNLLPSPTAAALNDVHRTHIISILTAIANTDDDFINLKKQLGWPIEWGWQPVGDNYKSAQTLIAFVLEKKDYPASSGKDGYTALGCLLEKLFWDLGGTDRRFVYDITTKYHLIGIPEVLAQLKKESYGE